MVLGGESFVALAEGLQDASWTLGGAPAEHRSDSRAAFRNLDRDAADDLTQRYGGIVRRHYADAAAPQQPWRRPRERHDRGQPRASQGGDRQGLLLRGSRDFDDLGAYRRFVDEIIGRANAGRRRAIASLSVPTCGRCRRAAPPTARRRSSPSPAAAASCCGACSTPCPRA